MIKCVPNYNLVSKFIKKDFVHFHANDLNIHIPDSFVKSYNYLSKDNYIINNVKTNRYRRFKTYDIKIKNRYDNPYLINPVNTNIFEQNVKDDRSIIRKYDNIECKYANSDWMIQFITNFTEIALINKCIEDKIYYNDISAKVTVHQVRVVSDSFSPSTNSPEGIHKDGAHWIISALIINKFNISGGSSIIYDNFKNTLFTTNLDILHGIFMNDQKFFHNVTPILSSHSNTFGFRDIIGLDIFFYY